ncbi:MULTISPECIES: Sir2 family NAD-dependent protein deacetylase [Dactylosporangium]|uniref:NAD-dependent protein deacetylase n=2 Tax=Dactylosporangium TaxID=35753 RepID=A0A9W6NJ08_9ACTN|nr:MULTISPECIES: Sir2 family NAD-dependent protein deacetylase [Dactylosporangium]UWZ47019.1 NAD-dependent deacetylase [Dactylosporangium matsuzakiense]GLK98557.1 NAD-dependent protein deacetylase 1 [Dactylosporangium matsuzakiense]
MEQSVAALSALVGKGGVLVLSGAGLSTESGIPDYRGPSGLRRGNAQPMTYQTFTRDPIARRRYWARSHLGWRTIARAAPNAGHHAVGRLQDLGLLTGVITQNVDGLHQAGGAAGVIELHGALDRVICLDCGQLSGRDLLDARLGAANAGYAAEAGALNPDGDVELTDEQAAGFAVVDCTDCGGMLKPDVVFFGETVPAPRVQACFDLVERSAALVVLGSSLTVMSGRRFVVRAAKLGLPVAIVNQGPTRGDGLASLLLDAPLGAVLSKVAWDLRN